MTCQNGATCTDNTDTGYTCVCAGLFTGNLCETGELCNNIKIQCHLRVKSWNLLLSHNHIFDGKHNLSFAELVRQSDVIFVK